MKHAILVLILLFVTSVRAETHEIMGIGAMSCGEIVTELRKGAQTDMSAAIVIWFQGYLSGRNAEVGAREGWSHAPKQPDPDAIRVFVENWCNANPLIYAEKAGDAIWARIATPR